MEWSNGLRVRIATPIADADASKQQESSAAMTFPAGCNDDVRSFHILFKEFGLSMSKEEWLESNATDSGIQVLNDDEIFDIVSKPAAASNTDKQSSYDDDDDDAPADKCAVSNSEAAHMLDRCMCWVQH